MCCEHCVDSEQLFSPRAARRDLKRYRRRGMRPSTRMLVDAIAKDADGASLLDIGGGVGAIQHELVPRGLEMATQVDASAAYIGKSKEEAARRGHADRITYRHADFLDVADVVPSATIVTLDRVICCYPDMETLVRRSAEKAERVYGLVFPRERWFIRVLSWLGNAFFRLRGMAFRSHLHPAEEVDAIVRGLGFEPRLVGQTFMWRVAVYAR